MRRLLLCTGLMLALCLPRPARGQAVPDSVITVPVPEEGIIYLRMGRPGGVRIHSRHDRRRRPVGAAPLVPPRLADGTLPPPLLVPSAQIAALQAEIARLERLIRRLDRNDRLRLVETEAGPVVVVLPEEPGAPPDTLYADQLAPAAALDGRPATPPVTVVPRPPARTPPVQPPLAAGPPTADEVEAAFVDLGLFRTLYVNFRFDESTLLPTAYPTLDAVAEVLRRHPDLRIRIAGHTDAVGPAAYNQRLSEARAAAARAYLVERGIAPERVETVGYGETRPLLPNDTPTGRTLNRRVAFTALNPDVLTPPGAAPAPDADSLQRAIEAAVREALEDQQ